MRVSSAHSHDIMFNVVLFAGELRGHEPQYLRHVGNALSSLPGVRMTVVLPQSARTLRDKEELSFVDAFDGELDFETPALPNSGLRNAAGRLASLKTAIERHRPDYVFLPSGDLLVQATAFWLMLPHTRPRVVPPIDSIVHGCRFAYDGGGPLRALKNATSLRLLARAPVKSIKLLSFDAIQQLRRNAPLWASHFELVPHPVDVPIPMSKADARGALGLPTDGRIVGCVGVLDERKGIDLLLRAFAASRLGSTDRLLLVGRMSGAIEQLVAGEYSSLVSQGRLILRNRFVSDAEMAAAIGAMDLVCTPYRSQYGVASIILNASAMGRPVLSSAVGWPLAVVGALGLGTTCDVGDARAFAMALEYGLEASLHFQPSPLSSRLVAYHSPGNFAAHVTSLPRAMLGLPPSRDIRGWSSVVGAGAPA